MQRFLNAEVSQSRGFSMQRFLNAEVSQSALGVLVQLNE